MAELTAMPKVAFSSTLHGPLTWANTELVSENAVEAVPAIVETRTLDGRLQLLEHVPTVLDGPSGAGN